jgi:hypothetical protein
VLAVCLLGWLGHKKGEREEGCVHNPARGQSGLELLNEAVIPGYSLPVLLLLVGLLGVVELKSVPGRCA